jgi:hypothetical protein
MIRENNAGPEKKWVFKLPKNIPNGIILIAALNFLIACACLWLFFCTRHSILPSDLEIANALAAPLLFIGAAGILFLKNWARRLVMITSSLPLLSTLYLGYVIVSLMRIGPGRSPEFIDIIIYWLRDPRYSVWFLIFLGVLFVSIVIFVKIIKYLCRTEIKKNFTYNLIIPFLKRSEKGSSLKTPKCAGGGQ